MAEAPGVVTSIGLRDAPPVTDHNVRVIDWFTHLKRQIIKISVLVEENSIHG